MRAFSMIAASVVFVAAATGAAQAGDRVTLTDGVGATPMSAEQMQAVQGMTDTTLAGLALADFTTEKIAVALTEGINPRTGDVIQIPAEAIAMFKAGKALKDAIN